MYAPLFVSNRTFVGRKCTHTPDVYTHRIIFDKIFLIRTGTDWIYRANSVNHRHSNLLRPSFLSIFFLHLTILFFFFPLPSHFSIPFDNSFYPSRMDVAQNQPRSIILTDRSRNNHSFTDARPLSAAVIELNWASMYAPSSQGVSSIFFTPPLISLSLSLSLSLSPFFQREEMVRSVTRAIITNDTMTQLEGRRRPIGNRAGLDCLHVRPFTVNSE